MGMNNSNNGGGGFGNQNNQQQQQMNSGFQGVSGLKGQVLQIIAHPQYGNSETGCNVETVFSSLSNQDVNAIREAIDDLCNDGHIYSTIDDDHYKCSNQ